MEFPANLITSLCQVESIVVLSGAGISAESGVLEPLRASFVCS